MQSRRHIFTIRSLNKNLVRVLVTAVVAVVTLAESAHAGFLYATASLEMQRRKAQAAHEFQIYMAPMISSNPAAPQSSRLPEVQLVQLPATTGVYIDRAWYSPRINCFPPEGALLNVSLISPTQVTGILMWQSFYKGEPNRCRDRVKAEPKMENGVQVEGKFVCPDESEPTIPVCPDNTSITLNFREALDTNGDLMRDPSPVINRIKEAVEIRKEAE